MMRNRSGLLLFSYRFAGIEIASDVQLSDLRANDSSIGPIGEPLTISHEAGPAPVVDELIYSWQGRYASKLGKIGEDWLFSSRFDGAFRIDPHFRTLRLYSDSDPPSPICTDVLVRRILPRLLVARGAITIHAAAVSTQGQGLLLLGASGAGKSTMTAALGAMPEWQIISDGLSTVWEGERPQVVPTTTGVCLWAQSVASLGLDLASCAAMPGYEGKVRFRPQGATETSGVPLRAFVFLARDSECAAPTLTPIPRTEAMIRASRSLSSFNRAAKDGHERSMAGLSRIAAGRPMLRLSYPPRYDIFPAIADLLAEQVV